MRTQQHRSLHRWNMQLCNGPDCDSDRMWPRLVRCNVKPTEFVGIRAAGECGHVLGDQTTAEQIWDRPERYDNLALSHAAMVAPAYDITKDMPQPMQIWNAYRGMAIAYHWRMIGVNVIPVIRWGYDGERRPLFGGMPVGGTFAAIDDGQGFNERLRAAISQLRARTVYVFGREGADRGDPCEIHWV